MSLRVMAFDDSIAASTFSLPIPNSWAGVLVRLARRAITCPEAASVSIHFRPSVLQATAAFTGCGFFTDRFRSQRCSRNIKAESCRNCPPPGLSYGPSTGATNMPQDSNFSAARTQLVDDFNKIAADTEALLSAMASVPGEKASALRASVTANLAAARQRMREIQGAAYERTTAAARATDEYVHENPWPMIGAAAVVGFVLGLLANRD